MRRLASRISGLYYVLVLRRTASGISRHFRAQVWINVVLLLLATAVKCREAFPGGCDMTDFAAGLWAVGIWMGLLLAFNLVMAPVRIHRDTVHDLGLAQSRERAAVDELTARVKTSAQRRAIRDQVARYLAEGEDLYEQVWKDAGPLSTKAIAYVTFSKKDWAPEWRDWARRVRDYLRQELGQSYVDQFNSSVGLAKPPHRGSLMLSHDHMPVLNSLHYGIQRLDQLLRELPNE